MRTFVLMLLVSVSYAWFAVLPTAQAQRPATPGRHTVVHVPHRPQNLEPYGGCDEAWQAPRSAGAKWCRDHGYAVPLR